MPPRFGAREAVQFNLLAEVGPQFVLEFLGDGTSDLFDICFLFVGCHVRPFSWMLNHHRRRRMGFNPLIHAVHDNL